MAKNQNKIIILNGTSSSGKTTLAKELQQTLEEDYLYMGIDLFVQMLPEDFFIISDEINPPSAEGMLWIINEESQRLKEMRLGPKAVQFKKSMYLAAKAIASTGFNIIIDDVILDERVLRIISKMMADDAYFIGVRCPKKEAILREEERGNRFLGMVETQIDLVHEHGNYDIQVNTAKNSPEECREIVRNFLESQTAPKALKILSQSFYQ